MNILIVVEKPSFSQFCADPARRTWPHATITFVHVLPYTNIRYAYPRGFKWSEYPTLSDPKYKLSPAEAWVRPPVTLTADGTLQPIPMDFELFKRADRIVFACDPDHTGAVSFDILLSAMEGMPSVRDCPAVTLTSMHEQGLEEAFAGIRPFGETELLPQCLEAGRVKRYFDWNWNVNAHSILGEACRRAGVAADAPPLSKYSLQLLYWLQDAAPLAEGKIIEAMFQWAGTGKYAANPTRLGSCVSMGAILENLIQAGYVAEVGPRTEGNSRKVAISALGRTVLDVLHPGSRDADLPFRLEAWCTQGLSESKNTMDRYIRTFFGKQKRHMSHSA